MVRSRRARRASSTAPGSDGRGIFTELAASGHQLEVVVVPGIRQANGLLRYVWTHPANEGRRLRALQGAVAHQFRGRVLHQPTIARLGTGSAVFAEINLQSSAAAYANPYDYNAMRAWQGLLHQGDLFIDVGASVGVYSLWARECGAKVIAVEPAPDSLARLERNLQLNAATDVEVVRAALLEVPGQVRITGDLDAQNHVLSVDEIATGILVASQTLDNVIGERVAAGVKIDVEGFELSVLKGATKALEEHRIRALQLEWNHLSMERVGVNREEIADWLSEYGYGVYRPNRLGSLLPAHQPSIGPDVFALPSDRPRPATA